MLDGWTHPRLNSLLPRQVSVLAHKRWKHSGISFILIDVIRGAAGRLLCQRRGTFLLRLCPACVENRFRDLPGFFSVTRRRFVLQRIFQLDEEASHLFLLDTLGLVLENGDRQARAPWAPRRRPAAGPLPGSLPDREAASPAASGLPGGGSRRGSPRLPRSRCSAQSAASVSSTGSARRGEGVSSNGRRAARRRQGSAIHLAGLSVGGIENTTNAVRDHLASGSFAARTRRSSVTVGTRVPLATR